MHTNAGQEVVLSIFFTIPGDERDDETQGYRNIT